MTRGKAGHYWQRTLPPPIVSRAYVLGPTGGQWLTFVPEDTRLTQLKVWVIGRGGGGFISQFGGSMSYAAFTEPLGFGALNASPIRYRIDNGSDRSTLELQGRTLRAFDATGSFNPQANGGDDNFSGGDYGYRRLPGEAGDEYYGGSIGTGFTSAAEASCRQRKGRNHSGLFAAVALAGLSNQVGDDKYCREIAVFGAGAFVQQLSPVNGVSPPPSITPAGIGGGGVDGFTPPGNAAIVLRFDP